MTEKQRFLIMEMAVFMVWIPVKRTLQKNWRDDHVRLLQQFIFGSL